MAPSPRHRPGMESPVGTPDVVLSLLNAALDALAREPHPTLEQALAMDDLARARERLLYGSAPDVLLTAVASARAPSVSQWSPSGPPETSSHAVFSNVGLPDCPSAV